MSRHWSENWKTLKKLGPGGQGVTYLAENLQNGGLAALKVLKEQTNLAKRKRMFLEVNALRILDSINIPKLIDSNVEQYEDLKTELYMISEYFKGPTLEDWMKKNGRMNFDTAVEFCLSIGKTLAYCHALGIYHRDIKPDNIILRDGNPVDPCLIDFGLSFNENEKIVVNVTPGWEQIGNRFLLLPELRVSQSNKHDPRSDVTTLVGLLIYALTGEEPSSLDDGSDAKPHQRPKEKEILGNLSPTKLRILNLIFDIGFNTDVNTRWQSIESLLEYIVDLSKAEEEGKDMDIEKKLESINQRIKDTPEYKKAEQISNILSRVTEIILSGFNKAYGKLDKRVFVAGMTKPKYNEARYTSALCHGIANVRSSKSFYPTFVFYLNGNEIVIEARQGDKSTEIMRFGLSAELDEARLEEKAYEYYISGVHDHTM